MTAMRRAAVQNGRDGFTLVEVLAAFAIASVIIIAASALVHDVVLQFDRGARSVNDAERFMLAIHRLSADFGSARMVPRRTKGGAAIAFVGEAASGKKPARVTFVGAASVASGPQGDNVVTLSSERDGEVTRLVRRGASWLGPWSRFEDHVLGDSVILFEGRWDISFVFARLTPERGLAWYSSWIDEPTLPRFVRLLVRDRASGRDLLGEADFLIRANAPAACGRPDAAVACLAVAPSVRSDARRSAR